MRDSRAPTRAGGVAAMTLLHYFAEAVVEVVDTREGVSDANHLGYQTQAVTQWAVQGDDYR